MELRCQSGRIRTDGEDGGEEVCGVWCVVEVVVVVVEW